MIIYINVICRKTEIIARSGGIFYAVINNELQKEWEGLNKYLRIVLVVIVLLFVCAGSWFSFHKNSAEETAFREIVDSTGAAVKVPVHPKRVVFLNASNMDMYYAAGGSAVGRPSSQSISRELQEQTKDIPAVGNIHSPNVETILSLNPDLVIGVNVPFHTNIRKNLEQAGIPLYINALDTYEEVLKTLSFFGELTGKPETAAAAKTKIQAQYDEVVSQVQGKKPPRTLIIFGAPGSFNMATGKSFSGNLLNQLGGGNIADLDTNLQGGFVPLSMEYITKADPQVILFISMMPDPGIVEAFKKEMTDSELWRGVTAVQENRIYYLSGDLFSVNPGTRIAQALHILYNDLYEKGGDRR